MANILITGGAGFIGSCLAKKLLENKQHEVTIIDNLLTGKLENLPKPSSRFKFFKADANNFRDVSGVMYSNTFDYIFHYAAVVGVDRTLENPTLVLQDIDGIKNILDLAKNTGVKRVFYSSSSEVYGEPVEIPQNEDTTPLNSKLPYAVVKNIGEIFLKTYQQEFGLDYTIFRFFNTYGPSQSLDFVMNVFIDKALNNEDIPVYGDGNQTRTFCHIDDNIEACIKCMEDDLYINDVLNIGNDDEITIKQLAEIVIKVTGSKSKINHLPARKEGDMKRRKPDNSKMQKILNKKLIPLEEGIKRIISNK